MLIAAALIELALPEAESLKARRRVARSVKDRLRRKFNVAVAEIDNLDDWHSICLGCVTLGRDPRHLRERLEKAIRFVDGLGLAELVADDVMVMRIDELDEVEESGADEPPASWGSE